MKYKKLLVAVTSGRIFSLGLALSQATNAEVSASAAVSSLYLWRGQNISDGSPAVSGELKYKESGFYTGIWGSSGDDTLGNEYDLFGGWGGEFEGIRVDASLWNYVYPDGNTTDDTFGDLSEVVLGLGYGPVTFTYYDNIAGATGYEYYTLSGDYAQFNALLGISDSAAADSDYMHLNLKYNYNANLSFTLAKIIDDDAEDTASELDHDPNFVVSYSLPLDLK